MALTNCSNVTSSALFETKANYSKHNTNYQCIKCALDAKDLNYVAVTIAVPLILVIIGKLNKKSIIFFSAL